MRSDPRESRARAACVLSCAAALAGCGGEGQGEGQQPEDPRLETPGLVHLLDAEPSALEGKLERVQVGHAPPARRGLPATLDAIEAARREFAVVLEDARDALQLDVPGAVTWRLDVQGQERMGFAARAGMRQSMSALAQVELSLRFELTYRNGRPAMSPSKLKAGKENRASSPLKQNSQPHCSRTGKRL